MQPPIVPLQLVPFAFDPLELAAQSFRSLAPPILRLGPTSCLTLHTTFMAYSLSKYNPIIWIAGPDPVTSYAEYPTGREVTDEQMDRLSIKRDAFHDEWNYSLLPRSDVNG